MNLSEYTGHDAIGLAKRVSDREVTPAELAELARSRRRGIRPVHAGLPAAPRAPFL